MKCEHCFEPRTRASANGAGPPRPGAPRPAEGASTPTAPAPRGSQRRPTDGRDGPATCPGCSPQPTPSDLDPRGHDLLWKKQLSRFANRRQNRGLGLSSRLGDGHPPPGHGAKKGAPGFPPALLGGPVSDGLDWELQAGLPALPEPFPALAVSTSRGVGFGGLRCG